MFLVILRGTGKGATYSIMIDLFITSFLYCSIAAFFLLLIYFVRKSIKVRERFKVRKEK